MATTLGTAGGGVTNGYDDPELREELAERLSEDDVSFSFFQAVRLLSRIREDTSPVGGFAAPSSEPVRFGVNPSLGFPAGEIQDIDVHHDGPWDMSVNFLGLVGHMGVLPLHYTQRVLDLARREDTALADFLDLFHHRLISLFYLAWERSHFHVPLERGEPDWLTRRLRDLVGLPSEGTGPSYEAWGRSTDPMLFYAGLLASASRSATGLEQLLSDHFGVPIRVEEYVGGWHVLEERNLCRLDEEESGAHVSLGGGAVVGDEHWDPQSRARLVVGPIGREDFDSFLPGGDAHAELRRLVRFYSADEVAFEAQLVLEAPEVPGVVLGSDDEAAVGWSTWLRSEPSAADGTETILEL